MMMDGYGTYLNNMYGHLDIRGKSFLCERKLFLLIQWTLAANKSLLLKPARYGATLAQGGKSFQYIIPVIKYFAKSYMQYGEGESQQNKLLNCFKVARAVGDLLKPKEKLNCWF